jgi:RNA-binding protein
MKPLTSRQSKYLRGLAHSRPALILIGKAGLKSEVLQAVDGALEDHELVKVKFLEHKDKQTKTQMVAELCRQTQAQRVGLIGHTAIVYRPARDPSKRRIALPDP